jgi:hypothetical protein
MRAIARTFYAGFNIHPENFGKMKIKLTGYIPASQFVDNAD